MAEKKKNYLTAGLPRGLDPSPDKLHSTKDWRVLFPPEIIEKALPMLSRLIYFNPHTDFDNRIGCEADFEARAGQGGHPLPYRYRNVIGSRPQGRRIGVTVRIEDGPAFLDDEWSKASISCSCPTGKKGLLCVHEAAALLFWEKKNGGSFIVTESDEAFRKRQGQIKSAQFTQKRLQMMETYGSEPVSALSFIRIRENPDSLVFFDMKKVLSEYATMPFCAERAKDIIKCRKPNRYQGDNEFELKKGSDGTMFIHFKVCFEDLPFYIFVEGILRPTCFERINTTKKWPDPWSPSSDFDPGEPDHVLNEYALCTVQLLADFIDKQDSLGVTDAKAHSFFKSLEHSIRVKPQTVQLPPPPREKVLSLMPRITIRDNDIRLGFKIGNKSGRLFVLGNISHFVNAYQYKRIFELTKKETLDFSSMDFTDNDQKLLQFLIRRVGETRDTNTKLQETAGFWSRATTLKEIASFMDLHGSLLDAFYDAALDRTCEYQDKNKGISAASTKIGHVKMRFKIRIDRIADARGRFAGAAVSGYVPIMIDGSSHRYTLNKDALSRVSDNEAQLLAPYKNVADASGFFRFVVGLDKLQEFYYRVLPTLLNNPCVDLEDECGEEAKSLLPPEPEFSFWLDYEDSWMTCTCKVDYAGSSFILFPTITPENLISRYQPLHLLDCKTHAEVSADNVQRFDEQEKRVADLLAQFFTNAQLPEGEYFSYMEDDALFVFLQDGIAALSEFGSVHGTDAFHTLGIRPVPAISVGVSVASNLMDLSVTSGELSQQELLDILNSYRARRRYHRLSSGSFIDLLNDEKLKEIEEFLSDMELAPLDVIKQKAHIPLYRALYLDRLLEEHDELVNKRDRTFRSLVKNFRTINDSDYEPPANLSEVMRPYQIYGFKWLKTLSSARFGGILADEMGLGKTLQMISLLLSDKEETGMTGSLIVCPASLVYNWQEEIYRFAPDLTCCVLAGDKKSRTAAMKEDFDVFITSYDLLRRDIALFRDHIYHICVLDEAQYIKNAKAAVTKAVKAVRCSYRYALTGTPIENRLSELWSIFDFLMPGFLYSQPEFVRRFEAPITKGRDEDATEQLRRMTSPFILRRLKQDVLKDLPGKMEEVRYARISGEQQKLYDTQVMYMKGIISRGFASGEDKIKIFAELTRIRQICCDPSLLFESYDEMSAKRELCMETVKSAIDGGHRILLFSQFTSMLDLLKEDLRAESIPFYEITGSTPKEKRISLVNSFNEGDTPVFLISLKAGGTGLNLTGADVVIHYDPWWNLAAQNQATDRAHRIGQTRQVTVYKLILKDTIEERILDLQNAKKDLAESILEGDSASITQMSAEELLGLLG